MIRPLGLSIIALLTTTSFAQNVTTVPATKLTFREVGTIPDSIGVAGPFAGVQKQAAGLNGKMRDVLIVAGGANFPAPTWETSKVWHDRIDVLLLGSDGPVWKSGGNLSRSIAYGAAVSTPDGVLCMGGNDAENVFDDVFLLRWDEKNQRVTKEEYPPLPKPCAYGAATLVGDVVYLAGGQSGPGLETAMRQFWSLDLGQTGEPKSWSWKIHKPFPGPTRAFNLTVAQHNGESDCVYVISGRRQNGDDVEILKDVWQYETKNGVWTRRSDAPQSVMAGTAAKLGKSHLLFPGGSDGALFGQADELKDNHPGFPKKAFAYDTVRDIWMTAGSTPANHVTTIAVPHDGGVSNPEWRNPTACSIAKNLVRSIAMIDVDRKNALPTSQSRNRFCRNSVGWVDA